MEIRDVIMKIRKILRVPRLYRIFVEESEKIQSNEQFEVLTKIKDLKEKNNDQDLTIEEIRAIQAALRNKFEEDYQIKSLQSRIL
jgi:hypothetical protein